MKTTNYLIYRHGSNRANQSMTNVAAVAIVGARSQREACEKAAENVTVYANQRLTAVPESRARKSDWLDVAMQESLQAV